MFKNIASKITLVILSILLPSLTYATEVTDTPRQGFPDVSSVVVSILSSHTGADNKSENRVGSGFIVDQNGYIVTNAGLINEQGIVIVQFNTGKLSDAVVIGSDKRINVALLKLTNNDLKPANIGSLSKLLPGDAVFSYNIGSGKTPWSLIDGTVTVNKSNLGLRRGFIQTNIPLEPAMAGGPLFNQTGEIIGINSAVYVGQTDTPKSFVLPIDSILDAIAEIKVYGRVRWGTLGLNIQELTPELAVAFKLPNITGALVSSLVEGSPAAKAGIEPGDIILAIANQRILEPSDIPPVVGSLRPGTAVVVEVFKTGSNKTQKIELIVSEAAH